MKLMIVFLLLSSMSVFGSESLEGIYLGNNTRCGVEAILVGDNKLEFIILDRKGEEKLSEIVPFKHLKKINSQGQFQYDKEYFGAKGKVKVQVKGTAKRGSLRSLEIRKTYSFFKVKTARCLNLSPIF